MSKRKKARRKQTHNEAPAPAEPSADDGVDESLDGPDGYPVVGISADTFEKIQALRFQPFPADGCAHVNATSTGRCVIGLVEWSGTEDTDFILYATGALADEGRLRIGRPFKRTPEIEALQRLGVIPDGIVHRLEAEDRDTKQATARRLLEDARADLKKFGMDLSPQQVKHLSWVVKEG